MIDTEDMEFRGLSAMKSEIVEFNSECTGLKSEIDIGLSILGSMNYISNQLLDSIEQMKGETDLEYLLYIKGLVEQFSIELKIIKKTVAKIEEKVESLNERVNDNSFTKRYRINFLKYLYHSYNNSLVFFHDNRNKLIQTLKASNKLDDYEIIISKTSEFEYLQVESTVNRFKFESMIPTYEEELKELEFYDSKINKFVKIRIK